VTKSNGSVVLHRRKSFFHGILEIAFGAVCFWAGLGWFFAIMTYSVSADAGNGLFFLWGIAFILAMAVGLNSGE